MTATELPAEIALDPGTGALIDSTAFYEKRLADLVGVFRDHAAYRALPGDRPVYRVFEQSRGEREGDLTFGTSILLPGSVGAEFHMTRGHLHVIADRTEIYHCLSGHGVLLMETLDGDVHAAELTPGVTAYVPPGWIHRSVNVGPELFSTLFCYPADAGHDYQVIAGAGGMRKLVVDDGSGRWTLVDNPDHDRRDG
jgi:glucose-6-phosphate isomerase